MQGNIDICHFNVIIVISTIVSSVRYTHQSKQNEVIEIFRQMILGSAQCYDGASTMSGCRRGQKLYTEQVPHALYVHCYAQPFESCNR